MGSLVRILLVLAIGVAAAWYAQENIGYVMFVVGNWRVETTFAFFVVALAVLLIGAYWLVRGIRRLLSLNAGMRKWLQTSSASRGHKNLLNGLMLLVTGRYAEAEKKLAAKVATSDAPLLNYLGAALAAQRLGKIEQRDEYLKRAHVNVNDSNQAVQLLQAQMQMEQGQFELALATLWQLYEEGLAYAHVLDLLVRCCHELGEWDRIRTLVPALRKNKVYAAEKIDAMATRANKHLVEGFQKGQDVKGLQQFWDALSRQDKTDSELVAVYCQVLHALGEDNEAERYAREQINRQHESALIELYGSLKTDFQDKQLATIEDWLKQKPQESVLLLAAGMVAKRLELWGKAKNYLETCVDVNPNVEAYRLLAAMAEQLGETQEANRWFRKAALVNR